MPKILPVLSINQLCVLEGNMGPTHNLSTQRVLKPKLQLCISWQSIRCILPELKKVVSLARIIFTLCRGCIGEAGQQAAQGRPQQEQGRLA